MGEAQTDDGFDATNPIPGGWLDKRGAFGRIGGVVTHLFTTPLFHQRLELPEPERAEVCEYLQGLRAQSAGQQRSNRGGWHSEGNFFGPEHRDFPWLREAVVKAILDYAGSGLGFKGEFRFQLMGWAVINGAGDTNVPHNHSPNLISGAFYLNVPPGMQAGEIVFMDPRLNLNASVSPALHDRGQLPPWNKTSLAHAPTTGDLLLFPSWLVHYVNAFTAPEPDARRIVLSFNASV